MRRFFGSDAECGRPGCLNGLAADCDPICKVAGLFQPVIPAGLAGKGYLKSAAGRFDPADLDGLEGGACFYGKVVDMPGGPHGAGGFGRRLSVVAVAGNGEGVDGQAREAAF